MWSIPSSRRVLPLALLFLSVVTVFRTLCPGTLASSREALLRSLASSIPTGIPIPTDLINQHILPTCNPKSTYTIPSTEHYYTYHRSRTREAKRDTYLSQLFTCLAHPNPYTQHIRLPNFIFNVSQTPPEGQFDAERYFNPTVIALPYWSQNHYLLVSRVVTEGLHQRSVICEANICHSNTSSSPFSSFDSKPCTASDTFLLGYSGGLRCATPPITVNIPPTPAEQCEGTWIAFPDIPGFHDPRIFWSGKGEPLIMVNSASRYGCVGLWIIDLRSVYEPLRQLLTGDPRGAKKGPEPGPLMSYPHLTELTRNPRSSRSAVEKNWLLYFPNAEESYVHYDIMSHQHHNHSTGVRSFAKLIGNGFTTPNLADPLETSCFLSQPDTKGQMGHWHQASNALQLILCTRHDAQTGHCSDLETRSVHFAIIHRKFSNAWSLPLRYERWFMLWDARRPFHVLAVSRFPVLFWNETVGGFSAEENWVVEDEELKRRGNGSESGNGTKGLWRNSTRSRLQAQGQMTGFTYTPSIAWAWRSKSSSSAFKSHGQDEDGEEYMHTLNKGYLDDEVIVGIGLDDTAQVFGMAKARDLLQCMRTCELPAITPTAETGGAGEGKR